MAEAARYAAAIVGIDDADDACQEAWMRIWRAWENADPERLDAWAFRIVRNSCIDRLRLRRPATTLTDDLVAPASVEDVVLPRLEVDDALRILEHLPVALRETLWLREVGELSYAEIAEIQGVPLGTVMSRLNAGRRKLAKLLRRQGP
ncbi:MAG TPA: RNA polymerase sigma factor [Acidimicrobiia bacterium]|nr:RNA polymerase sigma factor [Acidimicrobiia bacterium]